MKSHVHLIVLIVASASLSICVGCSGGDGGNNTLECKGDTIVASESNNYSFSSTLTFPPVKVAPKSNLEFEWGGITEDFIGHALDPKADLNSILLFEWDLNLEDLQTKLNADTLQSRDLTVVPPLTFVTDGQNTSAKLLDFTLNGSAIGEGMVTVDQVMNYFDPESYDPATHTYTLMAATGTELGQGTRMIQSFLVDPSSSNTKVTVSKDSTKLEFTADLTMLTPTGVPAGKGDITLDWREMKTNSLGGDFVSTRITRAFIGHYDESVSELSGDKFLDIEIIAKSLYQLTIESGLTLNLSTLKDSQGNAFSGIDASGTWLLGLQCGDCRNPAPWYLTVLKVCSE